MPENTVYVGRPSRWGNPFRPTSASAKAHARTIERYAQRLAKMPKKEREEFLAPLKGRNLACWCRLDQPCHAEILLAAANR
jgi:hypothetical protein